MNRKRVRRRGLQACLKSMTLAMGLALPGQIAGAQDAAPLIIGSDRGGLLGRRVQEVAGLIASGRRVEIRGSVCYSSCTIYLGAGDVCVTPRVVFGFHGPSWYGKSLPDNQFQHWSHLMADHYREPLRSWFLSTGRYRTTDFYRVSGTQLIEMGYPRC